MAKQRGAQEAQAGVFRERRPDGSAVIQIKPSRLDRPPLAGFASRCRIASQEDFADFRFMEPRANGEIETIVHVVMAMDILVNSFWPSAKEMFQRSQRFAEGLLTKNHPLTDELPTVDVAPVRADVMLISRAGYAAELEFHSINITSTHLTASDRGPIASVPIGTVQIPSGLLLNVLERIDTIVESNTATVRSLRENN